MANDWIKIRVDLYTDGRVVEIAHKLGIPKQQALGCLVIVWSLADTHAVSRLCPDDSGTQEGFLSRYRPKDIDGHVGQDGIAQCLCELDWLRVYPDGLGFPDWDVHNSKSAKTRASEQKKKRRQRVMNPVLSRFSSPTCPDANGTGGGTREEKRREDSRGMNSPTTPSCPEVEKPPSGPAQPDPVVLTFSTVGKTREWHLTESFVSRLREAFPGLDVLAECKKAAVWCFAAAKQKKTAAGMPRFLFAWLGRAQNSGTQRNGTHPPPEEDAIARATRLYHENERRKQERASLFEQNHTGGTDATP